MKAFIDFIHETKMCSSKDALTNSFTHLINEYGYTSFVMGFIKNDFSELTDREKHFGVMVNYPDQWLARYFKNHYIEDDPVYLKCRTPGKPYTWKEALVENPTPRAIKIMSEAKEFGLRDGIGFSFYQPHAKTVGFGISSNYENARKDVEALTELRIAAIHCFETYAELDEFYFTATTNKELSAREKEVLLWSALGHNKQDVAQKMNISVSCVKRYCESCFRKLDANNITSATVKAFRLGIITPF